MMTTHSGIRMESNEARTQADKKNIAVRFFSNLLFNQNVNNLRKNDPLKWAPLLIIIM